MKPTERLQIALLTLFLAPLQLHAEQAQTEPATPGNKSINIEKANKSAWTTIRLKKRTLDLSNERFSIRAEAARDLSTAPPHYLPKIRSTAARVEDPETRHQLLDAAKHIFTSKIVHRLAEWRIGKGFLGIQWTISHDPAGVMVNRVIPGTAAQRAGLRDGDILIKIDAEEFEDGFSHDDAMKIWRAMAPGDEMKIKAKRNGEAVDLKATIGTMPRQPFQAEEEDRRKRNTLWTKYLAGSLKIPAHILKPGSTTTEKKTKRATTQDEAAEDAKPPRRPLQSWPKEFEAPDP